MIDGRPCIMLEVTPIETGEANLSYSEVATSAPVRVGAVSLGEGSSVIPSARPNTPASLCPIRQERLANMLARSRSQGLIPNRKGQDGKLKPNTGVVASLPDRPAPISLMTLSKEPPGQQGGSSRSPTKPPPAKLPRNADQQATVAPQLLTKQPPEHVPCVSRVLQATPRGGGELVSVDTVNSGWARHHPEEIRPVRIRRDQREPEVRSLDLSGDRLVVFIGSKGCRIQTYAELMAKYGPSASTVVETRMSDPPVPRARLFRPTPTSSVPTQVTVSAITEIAGSPRVAQPGTDSCGEEPMLTSSQENYVITILNTLTALETLPDASELMDAVSASVPSTMFTGAGPSVDMDATPIPSPAYASTSRETVATPSIATDASITLSGTVSTASEVVPPTEDPDAEWRAAQRRLRARALHPKRKRTGHSSDKKHNSM